MGYYTNEIELVDVDGLSDFKRINSNLRALIVSIAGTIPGSRGFGLSGASTDLRPEEARNIFYEELDEKVEKYIPEIRIADVEFEQNADGEMTLRVYVEENDDWEDDEDD